MVWKEKEIEKRYYTIGEVAKLLELTTPTIRFWLCEFEVDYKIRRTHRGNNGTEDRRFVSGDIELLKEIKRLLTVELYTIPGAKRQLEIMKDDHTEAANMLRVG